MREQGLRAYVIIGGLRAWTRAGYAVETVPADDLVLLPKFS
jgi:rhodanese-related sulfurtransferase